MNLAAKLSRSRLTPFVERRKDLAVCLLLVVFSLVAVRDLVAGGTVVGKDTITQYHTWYSYLGERLSSGDIPAWNPYQFAGAPFAGDPLSGWTYLPAMILFAALPVSAAAKGYLFVHLLLAGLFTYALARVLRMKRAGALLAAVAYEFNVFMYWRAQRVLLPVRQRYGLAADGDPRHGACGRQRPLDGPLPLAGVGWAGVEPGTSRVARAGLPNEGRAGARPRTPLGAAEPPPLLPLAGSAPARDPGVLRVLP